MEIGKELTQKETIDGSIIAKVLSNLWRKYRVYLYTILYYLIFNTIIIEEYYFKETYINWRNETFFLVYNTEDLRSPILTRLLSLEIVASNVEWRSD